MTAPRLILAIAVMLLLPARASGFCRTWTCDPSRESCPPDPLNPECSGGEPDDAPMLWARRCVSYALNDSTATTVPGATAFDRFAAFELAARNAFEQWQQAACPEGAPSLRFVNLGRSTCRAIGYARNGPNTNLLVFRTHSWPYEASANALALTTVTANARTGEIYDADIEINGVAGLVKLTIDDELPQHDLPTILLHEAGHFLGLAHASENASVMYPDYRPGDLKRTLTPDDRAGVCTLYPADRPVPDLCDPTPQGGYVSTCPPNDVRGGCHVSGPTGTRGGAAALLSALAGACGIVSRRRRRRARSGGGAPGSREIPPPPSRPGAALP